MEIFLPIEGFEKKYQISNSGKIRNSKNQILKPCIGNNGYSHVALWKDKKGNTKDIHSLVASTFISKKFGIQQINHINGIKTDNRVENLEWVSPRSNMEHAIRTGLRRDSGEKSSNSKLTESQVIEIRRLYFSDEMTAVEIAKKYSINKCYIHLILRNKRWNHINQKYVALPQPVEDILH